MPRLELQKCQFTRITSYNVCYTKLLRTVNFCHDASREDVATVYQLAYRQGCKGVTIYRDGSRDMQVLSVAKKEEEKKSESVIPMESRKASIV